MPQPSNPPSDEAGRLAELESYEILDTLPDERFDRITRIASRVYGADVAFLSFIDSRQQWMKSRTTDTLHEVIARERTVCANILSSQRELVVQDLRDASELPGLDFAGDLPWRFYAGVPVRGEGGHVIGTLCVLREEPGLPEAFDIDVLHDLAAMSGHELIQHRRNAELERLTNTDGLTDLANRRMFDGEFHRSWRRSRRTGAPASLLLLDIDHFKVVNDRLGHPAGDEALSAFADVLRLFMQRPDDLAARIGGEEFALLLPGADEAGARSVADALLQRIRAAGIAHPTRGTLSASIGVATLFEEEQPLEWFGRADRALYAAKAAGRANAQFS